MDNKFNSLWIVLFVQICEYLCETVIYTQGAALGGIHKSTEGHFYQHEVVSPALFTSDQKLIPHFQQASQHHDIILKFKTSSHNFTIDLHKNLNLFAKAYTEKRYLDKRKFRLRRPHKKKLENHCFYHGNIRGLRHSMVALSTCHGISGYIYDGKKAYHVEPGLEQGAVVHRLYDDAHAVHVPSKCGANKYGQSSLLGQTRQIEHKNAVLKRMRRAVREPYDANINTRYVEMYIVNDIRTFESNGRDLSIQNFRTQSIINIVSRLYQPFNIYVALVGIENWTAQDLFNVEDEANNTLQNFLYYRKERINPKHPNDNAQFITGRTFRNGVVGKAIKGAICTFDYSGGVNLNLATPGQTAATIAHELGHNFGMDHDNYTICQCEDDKCIMAATSGGSRQDQSMRTPSRWSSCSMLALQEAFEMGMDYCLQNRPDTLFNGPVCGNGFTEEGEECDCGLPEECRNKCCNATTCRLTPGSSCATGRCCDLNSCSPKAASTLCRAAVGECDLPEFCWGNNPECPSDVYIQDGTDCHNGQSYCFNGTCKTHTGQCRLLWGSTGRVSDPVCFKHLNINGSKHGNCGYNWTTSTYKPCLRDDVMCGLLHCVHQNEKLMFWKDNLAKATPATFLTIGATTYVCRSAILDVGIDMPDPGQVPDGAKCDDRKICFHNKCTALSQMKFASCPYGCSNRGVCNSRGHCHCDEGFGAPVCDVSGNGGSVDSGPVKIDDSNSLLIGLLVFFLVICPLIGVLAFLAYRFRFSIIAVWNQKAAGTRKSQERPQRPSRPPPKPAALSHGASNNVEPPPPYSSVTVSEPSFTSSTHHSVHPSPGRPQRQVPQPPKLPQKVTHQAHTPKQQHKEDLGVPKQGTSKTGKEPPERKSRFAGMKMPNFGKSQEAQSAASPKVEHRKQEEVPMENITKRELNREISNPVLISTTDRRSKHLVKLENINVSVPQADETPPIPAHVSLIRNEPDNRRNRPLPQRPLSMPDSECDDEFAINPHDNRKSAVEPSRSPRMPQRPPPPPIKPNIDKTRQTIEAEISKIDHIDMDIPSDVKPVSKDLNRGRSEAKQGKQAKPLLSANKTHSQTKDGKSKPGASKTKSDASIKPMTPPKSAAIKTKSDPKPSSTQKWSAVQKPIFKPKPSQGKNAISKVKANQSNLPKTSVDKKPVDSVDDEAGAASVSGLAKMFEGQKKPLLSGNKDLSRTQSHGDAKVPMTPPKPSARQIRSVNV